MSAQRIQHDCAFAAATALLDIVRGVLLEQEHGDFHEEAYKVCKAMLEAFLREYEHEFKRLHPIPSRN